MNSFDIVMEKLSEDERKFFNDKNERIKKLAMNIKSSTKRMLELSKKADAFIKSHPGCDKDLDEDSVENPDYMKALRLVEAAYREIENLRSDLYSISKMTNGWNVGQNVSSFIGGISIISTIISAILIPFVKKWAMISAAASLGTAIASYKAFDISSTLRFKKYLKKEKEWASENPNNYLEKLDMIEKIVSDLEDDFKNKYYPWVD